VSALRFHQSLLNNGDLFSLTQPKMIGEFIADSWRPARHHRDEHVGATALHRVNFLWKIRGEGRRRTRLLRKIIHDRFLRIWQGNQSIRTQCAMGRPSWKRTGATIRGERWAADRVAFESPDAEHADSVS